MDEEARPTVGLYLRIPLTLHAEIKRAAAIRQETVTRLVQRTLSNELQRQRAGQVVAEAIRRRSSRSE